MKFPVHFAGSLSESGGNDDYLLRRIQFIFITKYKGYFHVRVLSTVVSLINETVILIAISLVL